MPDLSMVLLLGVVVVGWADAGTKPGAAPEAAVIEAAGDSGYAVIPIPFPPAPGDPFHDPRVQLQRRPGRLAGTRAAPGRHRDARLAGLGHVGDGDEPPRQGVHRHPRRGDGAA